MSIDSEEAADRIHSAAIHLLRRVAEEDMKTGISPARLSTLSVLVFAGPQTVTELARAERVKVPTMSRLVAAMEHEGLVRRRSNAADARSVLLSATPKGKRVLQRGRELRLALLSTLLERATGDEVSVVREAAEIIERVVWA